MGALDDETWARKEVEIFGASPIFNGKRQGECFYARADITQWRVRRKVWEVQGETWNLRHHAQDIATAINDHIIEHRQEPNQVRFVSPIHGVTVCLNAQTQILDELKHRRMIVEIGANRWRYVGVVRCPAKPTLPRERLKRLIWGPLPVFEDEDEVRLAFRRPSPHAKGHAYGSKQPGRARFPWIKAPLCLVGKPIYAVLGQTYDWCDTIIVRRRANGYRHRSTRAR